MISASQSKYKSVKMVVGTLDLAPWTKRKYVRMNMMRKKKSLSTSILCGLMLVAFVMADSETRALQQQSSRLLALIGQKCTVTLKKGDLVSGTLWDYGDDFVALKVKKGPLFSKTERFEFSEIKYIDDAFGNRIDFTPSDVTRPAEGKKSPTTIYFSTDDTDVPESAAKTSENEKKTVQTRSTPTDDRQPRALGRQRPETKQRSAPGMTQTSTPRPSKEKDAKRSANPAVKRAIRHKTPRAQLPKSPVASDSKSKTPGEKFEKIVQNLQKPTAGKPKKGVQKVATIELESYQAAYKRLRVLRYQTMVLFCVLVVIAGLMIFSKMAGLKASAYGKYSLFPSKLVKMNGRYGIIDQGIADGVKVDDIIRLYRKTGQKIVYRGKVQVKKVAEHYSAVEVISKRPDARLRVGDVGFRERNFIFNFFKRLRILTSAGLNSLGKGLLYTAQNIEVKEEIVKIDLEQEAQVETTSPPKRSVRKVSAKSTPRAPKKGRAETSANSKGRKPVGFGLD